MKKKKLIRLNFKNTCLERDDFKCKVCEEKGNTDTLDVHHIIDRNEIPNGGYVKENGITLCKDCHWEAEQYHIGSTLLKVKYHPDELFKLINSNKQLAILKATNL